jgi:hypothetical protein
MKKITIVLFAAILSLAVLATPAFLEARGGKGGGRGSGGGKGGHHSGAHGGGVYRGGSKGGSLSGLHRGGYRYSGGVYGGTHHYAGFYRGPRFYGGAVLGLGAAYYVAPWGWFYPGYPIDYYCCPPPNAYYPASDIPAPPPGYVEPPPASRDPDTGNVFPSPPTTGQIPPNIDQRRCQRWAPTGDFHAESRWNPQIQAMETVSVPNFAWQDYPCE